MRTRTVIGVDGRDWELRGYVEWFPPPQLDEFEHDVRGGGGLLVGASLVLAWVVLVVWAPEDVHVPWWLYLYAVLAVAALVARWVLRRPAVVVASTSGGYDLPSEHWTGMVRGWRTAREELGVAARGIRMRGTPGRADGPLQPVD